MRRILSVAVVVSCVLMWVTQAQAQFRGFGGDRGGFGGDRGGFGGFSRGGYGGFGGYSRGGDRGSDGRSSFFSRMDRNGNGTLEPDEIPDYAQRFIRPMLERAGLDPRRPVSLSKLEEIRSQRDSGGSSRSSSSSSNSSSSTEPLVPGFGSDLEDTPVPGFGPAEQANAWQDEYDRRTLDYARDTIRRYDKNRNGILERNEWQSVSWRSPDPNESDLNMDGKLTMHEMAERISSRNRDDRSRSSSSRSSSGSSDWRSRFFSSRGGDSSRSDSGRRDSGRGDSGRGGDSSDWRARMMERFSGGGGPGGGPGGGRGDFGRGRGGDSGGGFRGFFGGGGGGDNGDDNRESGSSSAKKKDSRSTYRLMTQDDRLPRGIDDDFTRKDTNGDGQLSMFEYASRWNDSLASEFRSYDHNGDGVITATEYVDGPGESGSSSSSRYASRSSSRYSDDRAEDSSGDSASDDASADSSSDESSSAAASSDESSSSEASSDGASSEESSSNSSASSGVSDRVARYVDSYLERRDKNKSGALERDEWSEVRDPDQIDADHNGKITRDELLRHYSR